MYKKTLQLIALLGLFGGGETMASQDPPQDPCADVGMPSCLFYGGGDGICQYSLNNLTLTVTCNSMNGYGHHLTMKNPWDCTKYGGQLQEDYWFPDPAFTCQGGKKHGDGKPDKVTTVYTSSDPCKEYGKGSCPGSFTNSCVNFFFASCHGKENCLYADCAKTTNLSGAWKLNQFIENPTGCKGDISDEGGKIVCKKK